LQLQVSKRVNVARKTKADREAEMQRVVRALSIVLTAALCGCVSSGRDIDLAQVSNFQKGVTTRAQVVAALGPPNTTVVTGNGVTAIGYSSVHAHANPAMFIPIVGLLATGATAHSQHVNFVFRDDVLQSWTTAESTVNSGLGGADSSTQVQSNLPSVPTPPPVAAPVPAPTAPTPVAAPPLNAVATPTDRCTKTASGGEWCS
jgi:hypothetical protein